MATAYSGCNQLTLLNSGHEYFPALLEAIAAARNEIYLETYIYADDATSQKITLALAQAAQRGVKVQVLVDGFGARDMALHLVQTLKEAGVSLMFYRPPSIWHFLHGLHRMHRKLAVVDGTVAFVGGINIVDDDNAPPGMAPRRDLALRIQGRVAEEAASAARWMWWRTAISQGPAYSSRHFWRHRRPPRLQAAEHAAVNQAARAALVVRDNLRHRRDIEHAYLDAIREARREVILAASYFFPSRTLRRALIHAAQRGVRVILLVQGPSDHALLKAAQSHLYRVLLRSGIAIIEYHTSFLHAKAAVVDNCWVTIGSSNIDPFSLWLSHEANVVSVDPVLVSATRVVMERWVAEHGHELRPAHLAAQLWWRRVAYWLAYRLARGIPDWLGLRRASRN